MILYTYVAHENIFPVDEKVWNNQYVVPISGGQLIVERMEGANSLDNQFRIVRLISTDPNLYLDERYRPGNVYNFHT